MKTWIIAAVALLALGGCRPARDDDAFVAAVRTVSPSVVLLTMQVPGESKQSKIDDAYATGIVVASGAWGSDVLTVQHAISHAWDLHVTIGNTRRVTGKIVAQNETYDIALVRVSTPNLPVAQLGSPAHAVPGMSVGLIGYPIPDQFKDDGLGLDASVGAGRVSSVRQDAIEVTLPIVPGESGSPVFLSDTGEIVGIAESRFDQEHSIGFALPMDDAKKFLHNVDAARGF